MKLFLCSTPLQLKIIIRIVQEESLKNVVLLFTGTLPNKRNEYYLSRLKGLTSRIVFFDKEQGLKKNGSRYLNRTAKKLLVDLDLYNVTSIYFANLNNRFYHHLLSILPHSKVYTFDDGTENVNRYSQFYRNKKYTKIRKWVQRFFGRTHWLEEVLARTKLHYTIYEDLSNVVDNTKFIPLYDVQHYDTIPNKRIRIFLGTVYRDSVQTPSDATLLIQMLERYFKKESIDFYIPHPREENHYFSDCKIVIPEKMSEALVISYIEKGYYVELYGFGGSTQLNLQSIQHVQNHLIENPLISERVRKGYALFKGDAKIVELIG